uniref:Uncharacterized protein n=1 Tax=Setaria italica TaxID=4555 RepID=K4AP59_SETIT
MPRRQRVRVRRRGRAPRQGERGRGAQAHGAADVPAGGACPRGAGGNHEQVNGRLYKSTCMNDAVLLPCSYQYDVIFRICVMGNRGIYEELHAFSILTCNVILPICMDVFHFF